MRSVDAERRIIDLVPAPGGRPPSFGGGVAQVDAIVREEMLAVYTSTDVARFLDRQGQQLLAEGREYFRRAGLDQTRIVQAGRQTLLFPWTGDRILGTLQLLLLDRGIEAENHGIALAVTDVVPTALVSALRSIASSVPAPDAVALAGLVGNKHDRKYDWVLTEDLLCLDYASRDLDVSGALRIAASLSECSPE